MRLAIAVILGYVLWTVLWLGTNAGLAAALPNAFDAEGMTQSAGVLGLILAISMVLSVVSGYTASVIHRTGTLKAPGILAVLLLATGIGVQLSVWSSMPVWYHLVFLVALVPMTLLGGRMRVASMPRAQVA